MHLTVLGKLTASAVHEGAFQSFPISVPLLNHLSIPFQLFNLGEQDKPQIEQAIATFFSLGMEARALAATAVYNNFLEYREGCCYEDVGCKPENEAKIWDCVHPTEIAIFRRGEDGRIYIQIMSECDWEPEHGLHLLFSDDGLLVDVSDQGSGLAWQD